MKVGDVILIKYHNAPKFLVKITDISTHDIYHDGRKRYGKLNFAGTSRWNMYSSFDKSSFVADNAIVVQEVE